MSKVSDALTDFFGAQSPADDARASSILAQANPSRAKTEATSEEVKPEQQQQHAQGDRPLDFDPWAFIADLEVEPREDKASAASEDKPAADSQPDTSETAQEADSTDSTNDDKAPVWLTTMFDDQREERDIHRQQMSVLLERLAPKVEPEPEPEPPADPTDLRGWANQKLGLDSDSPEGKATLRALALDTLADEFPDDPALMLRIEQARSDGSRFVSERARQQGLMDQLTNLRTRLDTAERATGAQTEIRSTLRRMPHCASDPAIVRQWPLVSQLFKDPEHFSALLEKCVLASSEPPREAISEAFDMIDRTLQRLADASEEQVLTVARVTELDRPEMAQVLRAFANTRAVSPEQATDDASTASNAQEPRDKKAPRKPSTPRGSDGGRVVHAPASSMTNFFGLDSAADDDAWDRRTRQLRRN